eukprot:9321444-Alexandrium_andersonii.AAC.1
MSCAQPAPADQRKLPPETRGASPARAVRMLATHAANPASAPDNDNVCDNIPLQPSPPSIHLLLRCPGHGLRPAWINSPGPSTLLGSKPL